MSWYLNSRGIAIIACMLFQTLGYAIAIGTENPHARYAACFFCIIGGTSSGPLVTPFISCPYLEALKMINGCLVPYLGRRQCSA